MCPVCQLDLNPDQDAIWEMHGHRVHVECVDAIAAVILNIATHRKTSDYGRGLMQVFFRDAREVLYRELIAPEQMRMSL